LLDVQAELGVQDSDTDTGDMAYWRIRSAGMAPLTTGMSILYLDLLIASTLAFCMQQRKCHNLLWRDPFVMLGNAQI